MDVGLIGVGLMGREMGRNILADGHHLSVLAHKNREPVEDLITCGAVEVPSAAAMAAQCDLVILCVTGSPQVEDVVYRDTGLLAGLRAGLIIVDCSTSLPESTRKVASDVIAAGGRYLDAPLTGTPKQAETGELGIIVGGEEETLRAAMPVLNAVSKKIIHGGAIGAGHSIKLINNFLSLGNVAIVAEAIATAIKADLDMEALRDFVGAGGGNSIMFQRMMKIPLNGDDSELQFVIKNAFKDVSYYNSMANALETGTFLAGAVRQSYLLACSLGHGDKYALRMLDVMAEINGTPLETPDAAKKGRHRPRS